MFGNLDENKKDFNSKTEKMELAEYNFIELFDLEKIQEIQDSFAEATGVASVITDPKGVPITKPSNFSCFCNDIVRKTEIGLRNCMHSDSVIGKSKKNGPRIQKCLSGGLLDGGASIMFGDYHIANWLIGQVLESDYKVEDMEAYAEEIGADKEAFFNALEKVNRMSKEKFEEICHFLYLTSSQLSTLAMKNLEQKNEIQKRIEIEKKLKASEEKYKVVVENTLDVISVYNMSKEKFTYFSPSVFQMRGFTAEEAMAESLEQALIPSSYEEMKNNAIRNYNNFIKNPDENYFYIYEIQQPCKNGEVIWVEISINYRYNENMEVETIGISRNIDERKKAENEILFLSYYDQLTGLYNRRYYTEELKRLDVERNLPLTIVLGDVNGLKLVNDSFGHLEGDQLLKKAAKVMKSVCRSDDIVARIGGDEFIVLLPKTTSEEAEQIISRISKTAINEHIFNLELSISFGWDTKHTVDENIEDVFKRAENYMYKKKLFTSPSRKSKAVKAIFNTLHEKNKREEAHSFRVAELCKKMGKALGLAEWEIDELETVGLMHDIGKVAIAEKVLNKNGKLTEKEWVEMKSHSEIGYRILSSLNNTGEMATYVLYHHERYDGLGYPEGLSGREIPYISRILSIVDSYDAMTSKRSYKEEMSKEAAIIELRKNAGTQFDPKLVEVFIDRVL